MMAAVPTQARPRIGRLFRFQWEPAQQAFVLLYPEGMVRLNQSAGEILRRCDGRHTVVELVVELEQAFATRGLQGEVEAFLVLAEEKGWVAWDRPLDLAQSEPVGPHAPYPP